MNVCLDSEIYKKSYAIALEGNRDAIDQINDFKRELDAVRKNLRENRKRLLVDVIVPISSKAMIRAKLVHTNEIYVNLGDRWFLKTSCEKALEISERMIERCNENIRQWEKETNLLNSNLKIVDEVGIFPTEALKEIIEPYDGTDETCWREQHRKRVREHRKRELNSGSTDEELFQQLDRLEIEEAAMRKNGKVDSDEEFFGLGLIDLEEAMWLRINIRDSNAAQTSQKNMIEMKVSDMVSPCNKKTEEIPSPDKNLVRRKTGDNLYGIDVVHFKHGDKILKSPERINNEKIVSPKDVYGQFLHETKLQHTATNDRKVVSYGPISGLENDVSMVKSGKQRIPVSRDFWFSASSL